MTRLVHPATASRQPAVSMVILALLAAAAPSYGCRDSTQGGRRLSDEHLLQGRSADRGGPALTDAERMRGWAETGTADLAALQTALRERFQLSVSLLIDVDGELPGTVELMAQDSVTNWDPTTRTYSTVSAAIGTPFGSLNVGTLLDEVAAACSKTLTKDAIGGACEGFSFDLGLGLNPIDGLTFEIDSARTTVQWVPPSARYNVFPTRSEPGDDPSDDSCETDDDCKSGLVCGDGRCGCDASHGCPLGFTCDVAQRLCLWDELTCTQDRDCSADPSIGVDEARCGDGGSCDKRVWWSSDWDASMEHPVLAADITWKFSDVDPDDAVNALGIAVVPKSFSTRFRLQAIPCVDAECTNVKRVFAAFRGPSPDGDLESDPHGLARSLQVELLDYDVEFIGLGFLCWSTAGLACAVIESEGRAALPAGFVGLARSLRGLFRSLLVVPATSRYQQNNVGEGLILNALTGFDSSWGTDAAAHTSIDLAATTFVLPDGAPAVLASDSAVTNTLIEAMATGAEVRTIGFDARFLRGFCGPDPRVAVGGVCGTNPGAEGCAEVCVPCVGTTEPACDYTADSFSLAVNGDAILTSVLDIAETPLLARLVEGTFNISAEVRELFGEVLADFAPTLRRFTDIAWCPVGMATSRCPGWAGATTDRVILHFHPDSDLDSVPDAFDLCPGDSTPDGANVDWDGDGHGNACDLCPLNAGGNGDRDGDGIGDACDCDLDGDGCNQRAVGVPFDAPAGETETGVPRCFISGTTWDQRPLYSDGGANNDGDISNDDCDVDDDNDAVRDDGAQDGVDTYTPCADGQVYGCDDNCVFVANFDQQDRNKDGLGDACDPICNAGSPDVLCDPSIIGFRPDFGAGIPWDYGSDCPACIVGLRCGKFADPGAGGTPGGLGCAAGDADLSFADGLNVDLATLVSPNALPFSRLAGAALIGDLDADGFFDLAVAIAGDASTNLGARVVAISSSDGKVLWSVDDLAGSFDVGAFTASQGELFIGLPSALQQQGAVLQLSATSGATMDLIAGPGAGSEGFGSSLLVDGGRLLVGAPFASNTAGRVYIIEENGGQPTGWIDGPDAGVFLGAGPIATFERIAGSFVLVGAPAAAGGAGEVFLYRQGELVARFTGDPGDRFGASLAVSPTVSVNGEAQAWIGAPGAQGGRGALSLLTGALTVRPAGPVGVSPGDALGAGLLLVQDQLYIGYGGATIEGGEGAASTGLWTVTQVPAAAPARANLCDGARGGDGDGDGACDASDVCPSVYDPDQLDTDNDGVGDACECLDVSCVDSGVACIDTTCEATTGQCVNAPVACGIDSAFYAIVLDAAGEPAGSIRCAVVAGAVVCDTKGGALEVYPGLQCLAGD